MTKVMKCQDKANKKRKINESGQQNIDEYHDYAEIPSSQITQINCTLIKFFIAYEILFRIVEHPFFVNFIKELNSGYELPTREVLANQLLERKLTHVNSKIRSEINKENNLTLGILINVIVLINSL